MQAAITAAKATGVLELRGKSALDAVQKGYTLSHDEIVMLFTGLPSEIRRLDLSHSAVGDAECEAVAKLLVSNHPLQELVLAGTDITAVGLAVVADALAKNSTLKAISFRGCKVGGGPAVRALAAALQVNSTLQELDVGEMNLDIDALIQFRIVLCGPGGNATLRSLTLDRPVRGPAMRPMLDEGAEDLAGHIADLLRRNGALEELSLRKCGLTDAAAAIVASGLAKNSTLRRLDLGLNKIGRGGADALAPAVAAHPRLEDLGLGGNEIQDEGVLALCTALLEAPTAPNLQTLDVSNNGVLGKVGHKTGHLFASGVGYLAQTVSAVPSLKHFKVWGNPAVCAVGQVDHEAAAVVQQVLAEGGVTADVRPYQVDGLWQLAHAPRAS
eukprot:CAMPEP_0182926692 /NCGR_PEP_ID=MMETSP0105_2-20130417/12214_1 /TAXON_ID=81532 ORGANISM="Acanthoeca-like sp., Strain 10tr" /NCGR_SAMPLE_ID=MMETSP0105_2 /ASSEMBLY_ACC=CAM_ASM_000205 /LENGTH=384 /DNA_ID=CAMNT_0025064595 /DNA_START=34 /DNA_END=1188 /DNA_ORIENTATION=+